MFKKAHGDVKKSTQKVLDPKKDSVTRLKHLRTVLENTEQDEVKQFFDLYYSHIYQVFYDNFILVETSLKQKAHKAQREELDAVLFVFEKILTLLPDLIHQRWQFHSIGRLMKKLLHPGNSLKLRREGVRLYMLWLQALQENASEECLLIFACLIPGFPSPSSDSGMYTLEGLVTGAFHNGSASDAVVPTEISAVLTPQSGERVTDDQTKFFLDAVLEFMVIQVRKLEWKDAQFQPKGFNFLFQHFQQHYLTHIFPSMSSTTSLYQPNLVIPQPRNQRQGGDRKDSARGGDPYLSARVSVIRWVVAFTHELRKPPQSPTGTSQGAPHEDQQKKHILTQKNLEESSEKAASSQDTTDTRADTGEQSHSNTSTLTEKEPSTSSISSLEEGVHSELSDSDMVKSILFSSRRNVDFVHEMLRQGMLLPFTQTSAVRKVIKVYQDWIQQDHPVFMEEPDQFVCSPMLGIASDPSSQPQDSPLQETLTDGPSQAPGEAEPAGYPLRKSQSKSRLRAASYVGAINTAVSEEEGLENVRAGKNPTLQVFFTNSANIFLLEPSYQEAKLVDDQVDMCKKVLNIYRWTVMNVQMDKKTWEQLLLVLLRITEATLKDQPVGRGKNTLGGRLSAALFQTLIVTWIKACLNVHISNELWDQLLRVLSSLTQWEELITEWAKTIETLTRVLARQVYGLDLNDLPLDKLSEQKAKRRKGKGIPVSKKTRTAERSFSRGWSRYEGNKEKAEQMRHRSATTVGAGASRESNIQQAAARARIGALVGRQRPKLERTRSQSGEPAMMQEDSQYPLVRSSSASDIMEEFARDRLRVDSIELEGDDMGSHDSLDEFIKQRLQGESSTLQSMLSSLRSRFRRKSSVASDTVITGLTESQERPPATARRSLLSTWLSPSAPTLYVPDTQATCPERVESGELSKLRAMLSALVVEHSPLSTSHTCTLTSRNQNDFTSVSSDQVQYASAVLGSGGHHEDFRHTCTPQSGAVRMNSQTCQDEVPVIQLDIEDDVETTSAEYDSDEDSYDDCEDYSQDEDNDSKRSFVQFMYHSLEDNYETEALSSHVEYKLPLVSNCQTAETRNNEKIVSDFLYEKHLDQQKMLECDDCPLEIDIAATGEDQNEVSQRQAMEVTLVVKERNENVDVEARLLDYEEPHTDISSEKTEQSHLKTALTEETVPLLWEGVSPAVSDRHSSHQKAMYAGRVWSILGNGQSFSSETSAVSSDTTCSVGDVVIGSLGSEDKEVASYCTLGDTASEDSVTLGHSGDSSTGHRTTPESATMSRGSATPSPSSPTSPSSRTPSPTILLSPSPTPSPTAMLESSPEQIPSQKDSPAAESMKLDGEVLVELDSSEVQSEDSSVVTGGSLQGWFPDAAVIVWRRMLGILGDVNEIQDPEIHSQVFDYLCELWLVLMKLRDNLGITTDNLMTPPPPELLPPLNEFAPWLFKAISLPNKYKKGQLFAYKLLCRMTIRRHDTELSREHLALFFHALHHGLLSADQDIVNVLVKNCCPMFFALDLSGSSMLVLDFIHAANTVANSSDMNAPRSEAQALLGSLLCIPNLLHDMPVLQPTSAETATMTCKDVKDHIVNILLKSGKKEPNVQARCTVLSCLGIYLYEELAHSTHHPKMKDAINVLLASLKFNHKTVAQVASDMLLLLAQQVGRLAHLQNDLPKKITESIALTITSLLSSPETSTTEADKKVVVSMLFCLLEWCMALPISVLLTTSAENKRSLILTVFKVLQTAVQGAGSPRHSVVLTELESICLDSVKDVTGRSEPASPSTPPGTEQGILEEETTSSPSFEYPQDGLDMVSLAARTVLSHLVDHIGHFPLGGGPAVLNSLVHEIDDCPELTFMDDLTLEIFQAPNVQFFVLNNKNIISVVEIPAEDLPGGGATGGLTTGKTQARMIVRDIGGKYAWDCSILWGPPRCRTGSCLAPVQLGSISLHDPSQGPDPGQGGETQQHTQDQVQHRDSSTMPAWDNTPQHQDVLDQMLQYVGHTSPECLQKPGEPLNEPAVPPEEIVTEREDSTIQAVLQQCDIEADYVRQHINDSSMVASDMTETCSDDPKSPFHHCRFLLNQLGMLAWEKRPHLDLLRKNDRLLRELKNLDSRHCRETHKIAVIYVAEGQEDKHSILSNPGGSQAYEDFVAGLAWEVDLTGHRGFMGGLQRNRSTGDTAPYYATSTMEVIFHVATRMPTTTDDSRTKKLRHLGNDEVHIVWSEHTRDYRHGIIATEFGDVLIVIYPLSNHLYRIQIRRKPQVPFFGPLFDGAIVDYKVLPDLVRATAINASRAKRANIPLYQRFYEERAKYVETIVQQHKDLTTFEEFSASVYAPAMGKGAEASSGGSQRDSNQSDGGQGGAESEGGVTLRHQQGSPKLRHRMSMKIRRSSGPKLPHSSSSSTTPPESPNVRGKKT